LDQITDDAQLLELAGREVWLVPGEDRNIKITTWQDMLLAEAILKYGNNPWP
jgi:2-C-methyl-D-erythritol 4-phosphate cytidylyltransferase